MDGLQFVALGALVLLLTPVVVTDLRERRIPNAWNLALGAAGMIFHLIQAPAWRTLAESLAAAVLTAALFLGVLWVMRHLRRSGSLGLGDVKFLIAASQWVGALGAAWVFVGAGVLALAAVLAAAPWRGLDLRRQIPFGPALAVALLVIYGLPLISR